MAFYESLGLKLHNTNPLERVEKKIKWRTDLVGIFPNHEAVIRPMGALMLEQNDEPTVSRRYMSVETPSVIRNDNDTATLIVSSVNDPTPTMKRKVGASSYTIHGHYELDTDVKLLNIKVQESYFTLFSKVITVWILICKLAH